MKPEDTDEDLNYVLYSSTVGLAALALAGMLWWIGIIPSVAVLGVGVFAGAANMSAMLAEIIIMSEK